MNKIVKVLIFYNFIIVSAFGLLNPVFAVFVTNQIIGGTLLVVGIAEAIYLGSKAIGQIFVGDYLDIEYSDKRNWRWAFIGSLIFSLSTLLYIFSRYPIHLYLIELVMGIFSACQYPAFYSLFLKHLDRRRRTFQISFQNTATEIGEAGAAVVGGLLAYYLGFFNLFIFVAALSLIGSFLLIKLYPIISQMEKKEQAESTKDFLSIIPSQKQEEQKPAQVLVIKKYGDPVLRDHAKIVKEIDDSLRDLVQNMLATMYHFGGAGLAANQVGELKRVAVVDIGEGPLILINPKIIKKSWQRETAEEGCLSLPGLVLKVRRPKQIEIETFQLADGKRVKIKAKSLLARAIIHETEHLDGILIIDKLYFWQRAKFKKQLAEIKETTRHLIKEREKMEKIKEKRPKLEEI